MERQAQVATASSPEASDPSGIKPLDAPTTSNDSPEGGMTTAMSDNSNTTSTTTNGTVTFTPGVTSMSQETHSALLEKAVRDATADTQRSLAEKTDEVASLTSKVEALDKQAVEQADEVKRLTSELDAAQVALKAATDEVTALKDAAAAQQAAAEKAELATKRSEQVRGLGLFGDQYISEKASAWADLADAAWEDRVAEWRAIKPTGAPAPDTASAMTGTTGVLGDKPVDEASDNKISPRRAVLGLSVKGV